MGFGCQHLCSGVHAVDGCIVLLPTSGTGDSGDDELFVCGVWRRGDLGNRLLRCQGAQGV